jgi:long-subunit acyl-CoA synthetase (AMP-forming)
LAWDGFPLYTTLSNDTLTCVQAYGLTETCGASFIANPNDPLQAHTVGAPVAGLQVRLDSIPDMNYSAESNPPQGEILMKGPSVFSAYHKRQDLTDEVKGAATHARTPSPLCLA